MLKRKMERARFIQTKGHRTYFNRVGICVQRTRCRYPWRFKKWSFSNSRRTLQTILEEGLYNPLIMRVGIMTKTFRLEAGNHRIQIFHKHNVLQIPVSVQITDECDPNAPNVFNTGTHNFDASDAVKFESLRKGYMKPSDVFKNLSK